MADVTIDDVAAVLAELFPAGHGMRVVEAAPPGRVVCAVGPDGLERALGGSVSGPTIFKFVDYAAFLTVNACIGPMRSAVLAQSSISFLEPARPGVLSLAVDIVQLGMRSAVTDVRVVDDRDWLVAVATLHFSLPGRAPRRVPGGDGPAADEAPGQPVPPSSRTA